MVLLVLAAIWAAVLLPPYLERRRTFHPASSVVDFHHKLAILQRTGDPYAPVPARPSPGLAMTRLDVRRRRRDVLASLVGAAVVTLLLAVVTGGAAWLLHLVVDALLLGYVALLLQVQDQRRIGSSAPAVWAQGYSARPAMARPDNVRYVAFQQGGPFRPAASATQQALLRRSAN